MAKNIDYRLFLIAPVALLLLGVGILLNGYLQTGEWFLRGIDLKSGTSISLDLESPVDVASLQSDLSSQFGSMSVREFRSISGTGITIEFGSETDSDLVLSELRNRGIETGTVSIESISPALGESFWSQAQLGIAIAFVFMGIIVFFIFRTFVPSMAVIMAAVSDILITLALMQVFGIELSLAGFAALLMLIGYSVDTDIMLTTRLLREKTGSLIERLKSAFRTGITMSVTTLGVLVSVIVLSVSQVLSQIAMILMIGLLVDLVNTWMQNATILRWYCEKKRIGVE